jgi:drug/metabolite transporter (DMT)-like permease
MPYLILVSLIWGFSFVIIKGSLTSLDPNFVSLARLLLSLALFFPFVRHAGLRLHDRLQLMLIGAVQFGFMYVAYIAAYRDLPAHVIALLTTTTPIFVSIANGFYAKKYFAPSLFLALLAVAGGVILEFPDQPLEATLRGAVLIQVSNAAFAFGQIAYRRWMDSRPGLQDKNVFVFLYGGAVSVTGIFSLVTTDYRHLSIQPHQWLALLYLGIVASGLSFFLWNMGSRKVNEGTLAIMNNMKIPVGVIASLVILRERTDWPRLLAGCALIAMALFLNEYFSNRNRRKNPA